MEDLIKPISVQARPGYHLYLEFSDGTNGEVDLADMAGKAVFQVWDDYSFFEKVHIGDHREIKSEGDIELCPDSLYLKVNGKTRRNFSRNSDANNRMPELCRFSLCPNARYVRSYHH